MTLNELNDYAGQHEVIAENLTSQIISELSRYLQDLKTERKTVSSPLSRFFFIIPPPPTRQSASPTEKTPHSSFRSTSRGSSLRESALRWPSPRLARSVPREPRSSLDKRRCTRRLAARAERDRRTILFTETKKSLRCAITGPVCPVLNQRRHSESTATLVLHSEPEPSTCCAPLTDICACPVGGVSAQLEEEKKKRKRKKRSVTELCVINIQLRELEWKSQSRESLKGTVTFFFFFFSFFRSVLSYAQLVTSLVAL